MSISDELRTAGDERHSAAPCVYGRWLATQSQADQDDLKEAWTRIGQETFTGICGNHGYTGSVHVIRRHYRKRCTCGDQ